MGILIGHASISENGTVNGVAGDSTKKEVCTRSFYSKPWEFVAIHPDTNIREKIATAIEQACANDKIGYSQSTRNTLYTYAKSADYNLSKITKKCNCDCSSLINVAVVAAGLGSYGSNGWTTSTLKTQLKALGFTIITSRTYLTSEAYCVRGAIYVKPGSHTVCALENGFKYTSTLSQVSGATIPDKNTPTNNISVDGFWGVATTSKAQEVFGTVIDGVVSGQSASLKKYHVNCEEKSWKYGVNGSLLIKAIQKKVGVTQDGQCGKNTIKAIQKLVGVYQDGYCGPITVKAFQAWLNKQ